MSVQSVMRGTGIGCRMGPQQATAARTRRPESDAIADPVLKLISSRRRNFEGWGRAKGEAADRGELASLVRSMGVALT